MLIFTENEIRQCVETNLQSIAVVEAAFSSLVTRKVEMPPIMRVDIPENNGEVDVKTAYIEGYEMFALKVSSGFFNNYKLGLPSGNGMMLLISTATGTPQALLLDNGYLTHIRTAAAGAISVNYLARETIQTVGVIGTGSQARFQLEALKQIRDFSNVIVYGRNPANVTKFIHEMEASLAVSVSADSDAEVVVRESDVVITTTPTKTPIIKPEWVHPGLHITAMGSDAEHKQELAAAVLGKADLIVCDVKSQCFRLGELHHALNEGIITNDSPIVELGEITSGKKIGRSNNQQITICDLTGTGVQDTAIALYAYEKLLKSGLGMKIK